MRADNIVLENQYNFEVLDTDIQPLKIINYREWLDGSLSPIDTQPESYDFSKITVEGIVKGNNPDDILQGISGITSMCRKCVLETNISTKVFDAVLDESGCESEKLRYDTYRIKLTFKAGAKMDKTETTVAINRTASGTVNNPGNVDAPCIIEVTPSIGLADFAISGAARNRLTGADEPITIRNLTAGQKVVIDGEKCTVTAGGANKFGDSAFWEFPSLRPGTNNITCSRTTCDVTIRYRPRYL